MQRGRPSGRPLSLFCCALACCLTFASGCGESDSDKVTAVVESYFDDLADRDYPAACAKTSPRYREILTAFAGRNLDDPPSGCKQILERIGTENDPKLVAAQNKVEVRSVSVEGDRATAKLAGVQRAFLRRSGESWKIDRFDFKGKKSPPPAPSAPAPSPPTQGR